MVYGRQRGPCRQLHLTFSVYSQIRWPEMRRQKRHNDSKTASDDDRVTGERVKKNILSLVCEIIALFVPSHDAGTPLAVARPR